MLVGVQDTLRVTSEIRINRVSISSIVSETNLGNDAGNHAGFMMRYLSNINHTNVFLFVLSCLTGTILHTPGRVGGWEAVTTPKQAEVSLVLL